MKLKLKMVCAIIITFSLVALLDFLRAVAAVAFIFSCTGIVTVFRLVLVFLGAAVSLVRLKIVGKYEPLSFSNDLLPPTKCSEQ